MQFWPVVLLAGIIAVLFAAWLARDVISQDRGTKAMQEVAGLIFEGAMAFLNRQYRTISVFAIVAALIIGVLIGSLANDPAHGIRTAIAFLVAYGELAIGLGLVLGVLVRPASLAGLLLMLGILFSSSYPGPHAAFWQYVGASLSQSVFALCFVGFLMGRADEAWSLSAWRKRG